MNKLDNFLSKHGTKIILVLLLITFFRSCGTNSELKKVKKELQTLQIQIKEVPSRKDLEIEGLKSEKRMIQSTDRKMLDVNRQSAIDSEIKKLQSEK
jgi:uncharacterized membrane protein (DUF106 family)